MSLRFNRKTDGDTQALGRSRGGFGSKIVSVCDAAGRLVDFVLVPGQAHELAPSLELLKRLPKAPAWTLADMACERITAAITKAEQGNMRPIKAVLDPSGILNPGKVL